MSEHTEQTYSPSLAIIEKICSLGSMSAIFQGAWRFDLIAGYRFFSPCAFPLPWSRVKANICPRDKIPRDGQSKNEVKILESQEKVHFSEQMSKQHKTIFLHKCTCLWFWLCQKSLLGLGPNSFCWDTEFWRFVELANVLLMSTWEAQDHQASGGAVLQDLPLLSSSSELCLCWLIAVSEFDRDPCFQCYWVKYAEFLCFELLLEFWSPDESFYYLPRYKALVHAIEKSSVNSSC